MSRMMLSPGRKCSKQEPPPMPPPSDAPGVWANMASTRVGPDRGSILGKLEPTQRKYRGIAFVSMQRRFRFDRLVGSSVAGYKHIFLRLTLKAPQPHLTDRSPWQRQGCCCRHLSVLQQPGVVWQSVTGSGSHLLVQEVHRSHGPGERSTVRQGRAVRSTVGDGQGHALQGAGGRGDLAERHHRGGDEARREVGRVGGQEERALLRRVPRRGGSGRSRAGAAACAAVGEGARWRAEGRAGVLRRCSPRRAFSSSSAGKRAESLGRALRSAGVTLGGGQRTLLLLGATGVSVQQRRDLLNREPLEKKTQTETDEQQKLEGKMWNLAASSQILRHKSAICDLDISS